MNFENLKGDNVSNEEMDNEPTKFLSDEITDLLVKQVGHELFAFYEYTAIAVWFENQGLGGFAAMAKKQACDETQHMMKVLNYLVEVGVEMTLPPIPEAPAMATDVAGAIDAILNREKSVTQNWRDIAKQSMSDTDVATLQLAQWFMVEQQEEESKIVKLAQRVAMADTTTGILVIDGQLTEEYSD